MLAYVTPLLNCICLHVRNFLTDIKTDVGQPREVVYTETRWLWFYFLKVYEALRIKFMIEKSKY